MTAISSTPACTTTTSFFPAASTMTEPSPGSEKSCSTMTVPPINRPRLTPANVMRANDDGRSASRTITWVRDIPLACAARM